MLGSTFKVEEIVCTEKKATVKFVFDSGPRQRIFDIDIPNPSKTIGVDWKSKPLSNVVQAAIIRLALILDDYVYALQRHEDSPGQDQLKRSVDYLKSQRAQEEVLRQNR